ncbi:MAG: recombinase family protein [Syntrophomonas sp.]|nr:recombinase family protein [Syntrophomonas sp.]
MDRIITKVTHPVSPLLAKSKVAAYARVSSGKDAMLNSLAAQVSYYSKLIQQRPDWEYVGVYADEALTGTKDSRPEFQRLLANCKDGKIDIVITKSISRFARNTVTLLETVRELKLLGIDVYFEEQNIHSISGDGELMLTILASYAQEESRSVSENCKWQVRNGFKKGKANNMTLLGYRYINKELVIIPEEAEIVQMIFTDYLSGMGKNSIMKKLNAAGKVTRHGKAWTEEGVRRILRNEKYTGDLLLQKTYVSDHLTKKKCYNQGELPQYFVSSSHEAIIDRETFGKVQEKLKKREAQHKPTSEALYTYPFTGKLVCSICGKHYRRRIANTGSKYAQPVWICSTFKQHGKAACPSKQIPETVLYMASAEVIGLSEFDQGIFNERVQEIQIASSNRLSFVFRDGHTTEKVWQDRSRSESWTEDMRQAAREKAKGGR